MPAIVVRFIRRYLTPVAYDALVVALSLGAAWLGRSFTADLDLAVALRFAAAAIIVHCAANQAFGLYNRLWRYASAGEVTVIFAATAVGSAVLSLLDLLLPGPRPVPVSVVLTGGFFAFVGFVGVRYRRRVLTGLEWRWRALRGELPGRTRVLIVGAGEAGQLLAWRFLNLPEGRQYEVVGFVDADPAKVGMRLHGRPVLAGDEEIPAVVARHRVEVIVIAIYNLGREEMRRILALCERTPARIKVLPDVFDLLERKTGLPPVRDVTSEDLLGRRPVQIDRAGCAAILSDKVVLVTGAAGSIGSELCRQVATFGPRKLLLLDNNESGLHDLSFELVARPGAPPLRCLVADVTFRHKLEAIFSAERPQVVFHAAAYKHVPLMEEHPDEAVRVNVLGTRTVAELACIHGAERFVFISTDKAVLPTSVMGATKRLGELLIASLGGASPTICTGVRFGNVLGSRGSVVPIFERQIDAGGPVTITDPEMTRFFMSIPEAVSLVIQAATAGEGGDLYVLDMGQPVRIQELAERLIRLRGLRPGIDIPIVYTGIRPGEKLHEVLTGNGDEIRPTAHPAIMRVHQPCRPDPAVLLAQLDDLVRLAKTESNGRLIDALWEMVGVERSNVGMLAR